MQLSERGGEFAARSLHRELVAADFADLNRGHAHEFGAFDDFHGIERFATDDDSRLSFAEEQRVEADVFDGAQVHGRANEARRFPGDELADAAFGECDGEAAFAAIVRALHEAGLDQADERGVQRLRDFEIATRR